MKLILARHGETEFNRLRKFYGTADVDINDHGKEQAELLARKLDVLSPTLLVTTNLKRTTETLEPLRKMYPLTPSIILPDFAEKALVSGKG